MGVGVVGGWRGMVGGEDRTEMRQKIGVRLAGGCYVVQSDDDDWFH